MKPALSTESGVELVGAVSSTRTVGEWRAGQSKQLTDDLVDEVAVALVYNGISHVVMMVTPSHLEEFAIGFSLSEGILDRASQIHGIELMQRANGTEIALTISAERFNRLKQARRNLTGRTGCGLCGAESLDQAIRKPEPVAQTQQFTHQAIERAVAQLEPNQPLQAITGAVHGAALCDSEGRIKLVREDVGRHNALDKLYGAISSESEEFPAGQFVLISSRASYEMVMKAAAMGVEMLVAVSAPTGLAIELAEQTNMTLVGFAHPGRHMVYTHPQRIH
ncbi:MAG: formate dehydrogenase accessory sulfurtransferase FdhD [Gammaproteobacteria bacterium]|nr:formate dehydrogenase accessory sulfurtransferase FdhD [Gammaproteobacteria bacterium]